MAYVMVSDCPHCPADNSVFVCEGAYFDGLRTWITFSCPVCHGAVVARVNGLIHPENGTGDIKANRLVERFPNRPPSSVPAWLAQDVARIYMRAEEALRREDTDAASMLTRKALEAALRDKFNATTGTLFERINALRSNHTITDAMADWAHEIRLDGNAGAHDSSAPDLDNTRQLHEFLHIFLMYVYTLPKMVEERRKR